MTKETNISKDNILIISSSFASSKEKFQLFFCSDLHIDSKFCDKRLLKSHLDFCKDNNINILIFGDIFDAMQGKNDPRHLKSLLKQEHIREDYFNSIIDEVGDFLMPYRDLISLISYGNHELTIKYKYEFDILKLLLLKLGGNIFLGGYEGFVVIKCLSSREKEAKNIYYNHGRRSNAEMTMGILQHKRMQIWNPRADIYITGDNHNSYQYIEQIMYPSRQGLLFTKPVYHLQLPSYLKRPYGLGYPAERLLGPKPLGGWLLTINFFSPRNEARDRESAFPVSLAFLGG